MKTLDIKLGYACNNMCFFCLNKDKRHYTFFSIPRILTQIDKSARDGYEKMVVTGGEPLLYSNFFEVISYAKKKGIKNLEIHSNGRILSKESLVKKLATFEPIRFLISLHFPNARLYKKYSQVDGFDETIHGIRNLVKNKLKFNINTVIMKPTITHLAQLAKLIKKLRVKNWQFRFIDGANVIEQYKKFVPRFSEVLPQIQKIITQYSQIHITLSEFPICTIEKHFINHLAPIIGAERLNIGIMSNKINKILDGKTIHDMKFVYPNCEGCVYRFKCLGIRKEYSQIYGAKEIKPILKYYSS